MFSSSSPRITRWHQCCTDHLAQRESVGKPMKPQNGWLILALLKPLVSQWHQRLQGILRHKGSMILRPNVNNSYWLSFSPSCDSQRIKALPHIPSLIHWTLVSDVWTFVLITTKTGIVRISQKNSSGELQRFINHLHRWTNVLKISVPSLAHSPESLVDRYQNRWELHQRPDKRGGARCHSTETLQIDTKTLYS